jgi:mannose-6-phosphate isomerase-like protein (cupin superfamily)
MAKTIPSIKVLQPNQGESLWALGEKLTFKLGPEDTGGEFGFAELVAQPDGGPPPHIHRREDEMFYVLDGDFAFVVGDRSRLQQNAIQSKS